MKYPLIAADPGNFRAGREGTIQFIVVHYTANDGDTARGNAAYFARASVRASAHFFVDEREVVASVAEGDTAWHCGAEAYRHPACRNANALGVELCSRKSAAQQYYFLPETVERAAQLVRALMAQYQIDAAHVLRHFDVTGKNCPAPFVENPADWAAFRARLTKPEKEEEADMPVIYQTLAEVPAWARPTVDKLIAKGLLKGAGAELNLEYHSLRVLVINDRAGLYG